MLVDAALSVEPIPREALFLAGKAFLRYRKQQGTKTNVLPDFFSSAHTQRLPPHGFSRVTLNATGRTSQRCVSWHQTRLRDRKSPVRIMYIKLNTIHMRPRPLQGRTRGSHITGRLGRAGGRGPFRQHQCWRLCSATPSSRIGALIRLSPRTSCLDLRDLRVQRLVVFPSGHLVFRLFGACDQPSDKAYRRNHRDAITDL